MIFTDTHCHIHEAQFPDAVGALSRAKEYGVARMICVGTDAGTSAEAVQFAASYDHIWASVGLHPHDAVNGAAAIAQLKILLKNDNDAKQGHVHKIVAIGECGLDYFYHHSSKKDQVEMLHAQIRLAIEFNKPLIFHVREAFDDFWPIFDQYKGLRGVIHSFTDSEHHLHKALDRGLYIGVNGISTFTKSEAQRTMFESIPLQKLLLETDSPFLTPVPKRGKVNEPAFVTHVAHHIANLQSINLEELSRATEQNATHLFFK